ncbi:MAG TPA: peroxiredoxin [Blastocatellia bacterium]|nr:peroxiredoxin [Blastocatellia bacterium]
MTKKNISIYLVVCVVLAFSAIAFGFGDPPAAGVAAPDFKLPTTEGGPVSLKDYKGKWVVLYFYPRDMTSGCTMEAHNFQADLAKYTALNTVILGVSVDSVDSHKEFCTKESLTFKLLADTDHTVTDTYGSLIESKSGVKYAARNTFIIDPNGKIAKVYLKVNPMGHSAEVLAALAELQKK